MVILHYIFVYFSLLLLILQMEQDAVLSSHYSFNVEYFSIIITVLLDPSPSSPHPLYMHVLCPHPRFCLVCAIPSSPSISCAIWEFIVFQSRRKKSSLPNRIILNSPHLVPIFPYGLLIVAFYILGDRGSLWLK